MSGAVKVKPLEWHMSRMASWNDDWHTVPTGYTIRCADEWGWKWQSPLGAFGFGDTPAAAQAAAQADHDARILAALDLSLDPRIAALVDAATPFYAAVFNDNGDVTISTGHLTAADWLKLDAALAAMKGGDV